MTASSPRGASVHYRVTGRTNFLEVARKAADCLDAVFQKPTPELALHNVCPSHYMGMVELYRATGEPRYLALAKKFLALRDLVKDGGSDNQDRIPFVKQDEAEGHAVRANIRTSVDHLRHGSALLEELIARDGLLVVGAEYSLETGRVEFFDGVP